MKIKTKDFRVSKGDKVKLDKWPTDVKPFYQSKEHYLEILQENIKDLSDLQRIFYAANQNALLLIFQGMDGSGKDGAIRHVMSGINPQGCSVHSFKQPSVLELQHDFLWRAVVRLPERGRIGIFNRSYYEEVLVVRVHPEILKNEALPKETLDDKNLWRERYRSIVDMENHLHRNGTHILKFYLHLSKKEQQKRFLSRIDDPDKNWKLSLSDIQERKYWNQYMKAYEECLEETSNRNAPWYVIPADDKENARLIISRILLDTMKDLKLSYPKMSQEHMKELQNMCKELVGKAT